MTHAPERAPGAPNRLAREKSPYLLQHARNPVDWYAWGEEAFAKARAEDKPLFLSIGYSTCHWCHVMERESFENDAVAALLNADFVAVKVDREERPDVDRIYMTAMQALGMGGGWPLNVFLTPGLEPFFGGTYFPPATRHGRIGMTELLPRVASAWREERDNVLDTGRRVLEALGRMGEDDGADPDRARAEASAWRYLERAADRVHGGFGGAPKFPSAVNLQFLARHWARDPGARADALALVRAQLDAMAAGGIHDHLGGGFHRYATDAEWLVPHFEKMLYDQAQLAWCYLDAFQIARGPRDAEVARGVFEYVSRDLTSPDGAFLSAEDADSEGEEGRFYVWTPADLEARLGADDARLFAHRYGVTAAGNFEHGTTILSEVRTLPETAGAFGLAPDEAKRRLDAARAALLAARAGRPRPHLDDKVLAAWNGLMISAFARGAVVLGDASFAERAERAASFVWSRLFDERSGELKRRWRDGEAARAGQLDDYAYLALGALDLWRATHAPRWLARAERLTREMLARFRDEQAGGFFESPAGDPSVRVRMKDGFDGAEIAGNSIAAWNLVTLAGLFDREAWRSFATKTLDHFARRLGDGGAAMPQLLVAMDLAAGPARHVVVAGESNDPRTRAMIAAFHDRFLPRDTLVLLEQATRAETTALLPWTAPLVAVDGRPTAYVCVNYACRLPVFTAEEFGALLDEPPARPIAPEETR